MNLLNSQFALKNQNLISSVLLAEIAGYEDRPVFEQIAFTTRTRQLMEQVAAESDNQSIMIVDRENSLVLLFPGDPRDCLAFANSLATFLEGDQNYADLPLQIGVNLGAVTVTRGELSQIELSGAGIDDAERVARAGMLREILLSRAFYAVLSRTSINEGSLRHKAFISDELDRSFAVYQLTRAQPAAIATAAPAVSTAHMAPPSRISRQRWSAMAASALMAAGAFALFYNPSGADKQTVAVVKKPIPAAITTPAVASVPAPSIAAAQREIAVAAPIVPAEIDTEIQKVVAATRFDRATEPVAAVSEVVSKESTRKPPAPRQATLQLAIRPWGEIYVDGKKVGVTPPLQKIKLPPGKREIVVRNADFLPFHTTIDIQPESLLQISHRFD